MDTSPERVTAEGRTCLTDGGTQRDESAESGDENDEGLSAEIEGEIDEDELQQARDLLSKREGNVGFDSTSGAWIQKREAHDGEMSGDEDGTSVGRRGAITYLGGSMLGIFALAGAGWFSFIRETRGPEEELVVDYWDYIDRAKYNSTVLLFHRNAPVDPPSPETIAIYSQATISVDETEIIDSRDDFDAESVRSAALVRAEISLDWGSSTETMNPVFVVAQNEEENWKMWDDGRHNDNVY